MAMNMDAMLRIKADVQGENNIRRLGNSMQGLQGQAKNAALGFNTLKGAVGGFAAAIAGSAIVGGLTAIVKKSIDAGDELFNLQAKTGIAAKQLIGIGNAAKLADVDMGTLSKRLGKLNVNLVKAAEGNDGLAQKFKALGVNVKDANGQVVPADKALKQIADRFADMPDGAQKAAAAVALFGKSGADLIPLLNEGAASMDKFIYKVGDDFAARSDLFNDTITELGIKTQGFGLELTDALLDADPAAEVTAGGAAVVAALVPCRPRELRPAENNPRGAVAGAAINSAFMGYYQRMAHVNFRLRQLSSDHTPKEILACFARVVELERERRKQKNKKKQKKEGFHVLCVT